MKRHAPPRGIKPVIAPFAVENEYRIEMDANVGSNVGAGGSGNGSYLMPGLAYLNQGGTGLLNDGSDNTLYRLLTGALSNPYYSTTNNWNPTY